MSAGSPKEVFGPYLVYEQLGVGGMAQVHRADVPGIEGFRRSVALKRMLPHVATNPEHVQGFVKEARLASHLRHTNVPQMYELGMVDGIYFMAMELIEGYTLREVLQHAGPTTGPMPVSIALAILNQLCDALDYAHNCCDDSGHPLGIIHRDVSPSNVIVSEGGVVKLIDFGIAKYADDSMPTMLGTIKGKFGYMAPEYIAGRLDARADLFALGVIAHELLTNRPLFTAGDDMTTLQRVQSMEIEPPSRTNPAVPPEIDDIVMTALARDPDKRWQQASALRSAMTTLTKRLGMAVQSSKIIEWITYAFEHTRPHYPIRPDLGDSTSSVSMIIEPPSPIDRAADSTTTALTQIGVISPSGRMSAQSSAQVSAQISAMIPVSIPTDVMTVGSSSRHEELVPTDSLLIDELATQVRMRAAGGGSLPTAPGHAVPSPPAAAPPLVRGSQPQLGRMSGSVPSVEPLPAPAAMVGLPPPPPRTGGWVVALLVVLLAAAVAVGVYLVLPLVT